MIKIFFTGHSRWQTPHQRLFTYRSGDRFRDKGWRCLPDLEEKTILLANGIEIVEVEEAADIVFLFSDGVKPDWDFRDIPEKAKKIKKPVIVCERLDSAKTWFRRKRHIADNVIAIFKNRKTRNIELENEINFQDKLKGNDYTRHPAPRSADYKGMGYCDPEVYSKIHSVLWDFYSSHLDAKCQKYNKTSSHIGERPIDAFCVNTSRVEHRHGRYREKAKKIVSDWGKENLLITKVGGAPALPINHKVYEQELRKSKMIVSCWGHGEWCHSDGYAFFNKIILIKPNCDYIYQWPDIYQSGKTYVPCKPDYSDLSDVLSEVHSNYNDYIEMLHYNQRMVSAANAQRALIQFADTIKKVINDQ